MDNIYKPPQFNLLSVPLEVIKASAENHNLTDMYLFLQIHIPRFFNQAKIHLDDLAAECSYIVGKTKAETKANFFDCIKFFIDNKYFTELRYENKHLHYTINYKNFFPSEFRIISVDDYIRLKSISSGSAPKKAGIRFNSSNLIYCLMFMKSKLFQTHIETSLEEWKNKPLASPYTFGELAEESNMNIDRFKYYMKILKDLNFIYYGKPTKLISKDDDKAMNHKTIFVEKMRSSTGRLSWQEEYTNECIAYAKILKRYGITLYYTIDFNT